MGEVDDLEGGLSGLDAFHGTLRKALADVRSSAGQISDGVDELVGGHTRHKGAWRDFQSWDERFRSLLGELEDHGASLPVARLRDAMDSELQSAQAGRQKRMAEWDAEETDVEIVVVQPVEVIERDTTVTIRESADGEVTIEEETTVRVVEEVEVVEVEVEVEEQSSQASPAP